MKEQKEIHIGSLIKEKMEERGLSKVVFITIEQPKLIRNIRV